MQEGRKLAADGIDLVKVDIAIKYLFLFVAGGFDHAKGVCYRRVPPAFVIKALVSRSRRSDEEHLVILSLIHI